MNFQTPKSLLSKKEPTLDERIKTRIDDIESRKKYVLEHYANDSMFDIHDNNGKLIPTQRRFIILPNPFFYFIDIFPGVYALFTDSRQGLPYIFSNESGEFRTLVSPEPNGYSREHITQYYMKSQKPELYWLHREFN